MIDRKWIRIAVISFSGAILLTQYQNCAAPVNTLASREDGTVRVVEDWMQSKVTFVDTHVEIHADADEVNIEGLCARQEAGRLSWALNWEGREVVGNGAIACQGGGFELKISEVADLECGDNYWLSVMTADGEGSTLLLKKRCQPIISRITNETELGRQNCYFEKVLQTGTELCQQVCYMENRAYFVDNVLGEQCERQFDLRADIQGMTQ